MSSEPAGGSGIGPARFAFVYALGATAAFAAADSSETPLWGAIAGLAAFVVVSTVLLYVVLRRHAVRLGASQTELMASLSRYRELFEASPDPMWVFGLLPRVSIVFRVLGTSSAWIAKSDSAESAMLISADGINHFQPMSINWS